MLTELDDDKCHTEWIASSNINIERLRMKIKYMEKDNKDLQMDLEDVEATLQINKTIIDTLVEMGTSINTKSERTLKLQKKENQILVNKTSTLMSDWNQIKAELLLKDQMLNNKRIHEDEQVTTYEIEIQRLVDHLEKKEYTLQLLE